jgi:hypothetical protein
MLNKSNRKIKEILDAHVNWDEIVEKLVELIRGVEVQKFDKKGKPVIYLEKPDVFAAKLLLEYRYGKPSQQIDLTTRQEFTQPFISVSKDGDNISLKVNSQKQIGETQNGETSEGNNQIIEI